VPQSADAERRQLTVLFCDLVDSTRLAGQLDPEDLRDVVRAYQAACAEVIQQFEGHIAQYLGDGLLVYFGYPQAHEDDAHRAVRTGVGIVEGMRELNSRLAQEKGIRLAVRLGIHTGVVVVGAMGGGGRQEQLALGETPNLAARLQGLAAPDTVVISEATAHLIQGYFVCQPLGTQALKGVSAPFMVYQVLKESGAQTRLDVVTSRGLTPLVGRDEEVALLHRRWDQATTGVGQVVLISGEAGIGKSRLVRVLTEQMADEGTPRLTLRCSPYHTNSAFHPVIEHLQRLLQWHRNEAPEARLAMLEQALQTAGLSLEEGVPLLAALLTVSVLERYPPLTLSPQRQKRKTQETLVAWLLAEAMRQPVLVVWEDLHWADPSTLELLALLLDQVPTTRLLLVLTARPEFRPPWVPRSYVTSLTLTRLTRHQSEEMVLRVTGGKPLPAEVLAQVAAKTDGIPLFVEELVKTILEAGLVQEDDGRYRLTGPLPPLAIPATLQDALMARLDRLAVGKEVAQLGAVLGREFSYALLQAVVPLDEAIVQQALAQLVEGELLYQRGMPPQATYVFKHALIQEAAYQSLLKRTRQQSHQRIAQVLVEQFPETAETQPELLAHHYTAASLPVQAVAYWHQAGQQAVWRSAHREAIAHLTKGLEVLQAVPDTPARMQQELALHLMLCAPLQAVKGMAAPEVMHAYTRAHVLCQQVGEAAQLSQVLWGLYAVHHTRAEWQTAWTLGEQLLALAQRLQNPEILLEAHRALGGASFFLGQCAAARTYMEQGLALYDAQQYRSHTFLYSQNPKGQFLAVMAWSQWICGYPAQARRRSDELLAFAQACANPHDLTYALVVVAALHQFRCEVQAVQARADTAVALATEHGFALWRAYATILRGWALAAQGQAAEGIASIRQGITAWQATGAAWWRPYFLALLAEAYGKARQTGEALDVLAEALTIVQKTGERVYEAELQRLTGELLLTQEGTQHAWRAAEERLDQALAIARRQQAKSLELRAAMSLSRLWQQQGKRVAACELLAPIYCWFTEGFDTADLQEAKTLLEALT
jgi:predicted ATPase/class 3 adenylate cyclase